MCFKSCLEESERSSAWPVRTWSTGNPLRLIICSTSADLFTTSWPMLGFIKRRAASKAPRTFWGMNHAWNHPLFRHEAGGEAAKLQDPCQKPEGVHRLLSHAAYFLGYCFCLPVSLCFEKYEKCFPCEFCSCMSDFAKSPSGSRIFVWKLIDSSAVLSVLSWPSNGHRYGSAWPSTEQHPATFCNTPLKLTQSRSHQENQML